MRGNHYCYNVVVNLMLRVIHGALTKIHGGSKLQVPRCIMFYIGPDGETLGPIQTWSDTLPVIDGSARAVFDLVSRQLAVVKCAALEPDCTLASNGFAFRLTFAITDAGEDISAAKQMMSKVVNARQYEHQEHLDCCQHQGSLAQKTQLKMADYISEVWNLPHTYYENDCEMGT